MADEENILDIDGLASSLAGDIDKLSEAARAKPPADLRDIDFSAVLPGMQAKANSEMARFNKEAQAAAKGHEAQVKDVAGEIKKTAQARQKVMKKSLADLQKSEFKDADEAKTVIARLKGDIGLVERGIEDMKLARAVKPSVVIKDEALDKKIAAVKPLRKTTG